MSTTSQAINVNHHSLISEDQQNQMMPNMQMGGFNDIPFPTNLMTFPPLGCNNNNQPLKAFSSMASPSLASAESDSTSNLTETLLAATATTTDHQKSISSEYLTSSFGGTHHQFLSLHRSSLNPWALGSDCFMSSSKRCGGGVDIHDHHHHHVGISAMKMKKMKGRRKVREPRFSFKTMSDVDVLDDGYKWRKYGQKVVKNTQHPRSYYRCTQDNCRVKKRVERLAEDPRMVITTYEGRHVHSPSNDLDDSDQSHSQILNNFLW